MIIIIIILIIILIMIIIIIITTILVITKGKVTETPGMNLPNNNIKGLNMDETYKYIGNPSSR